SSSSSYLKIDNVNPEPRFNVPFKFLPKKRYRLGVSVRVSGTFARIEVTLDQRRCIQWAGELSEFPEVSRYRQAAAKGIQFSVSDPVAIHKLELRVTSGFAETR
ncbi:MAG: hypothetical protein N2C14_26600, partial [Planctomycetales bacterium]